MTTTPTVHTACTPEPAGAGAKGYISHDIPDWARPAGYQITVTDSSGGLLSNNH